MNGSSIKITVIFLKRRKFRCYSRHDYSSGLQEASRRHWVLSNTLILSNKFRLQKSVEDLSRLHTTVYIR